MFTNSFCLYLVNENQKLWATNIMNMSLLLHLLTALMMAVSGQIPDDAERALKNSNATYNWIVLLLFVPGIVALIYAFLKNRKLRKQRKEADEASPLLFTTEDIIIGEMNE